MKKIIAITLVLMFALTGCSSETAQTGASDLSKHIESYAEGKLCSMDIEYEQETARAANEEIMKKKIEAEAQAVREEEQQYEPVYYEEPMYYAPTYSTPSDGLTAQSGVNYYDGRRETYYSSNVLYHYRTNEWSIDSEGFYRTNEGYYVVAASDIEQGTVFEGSKGDCIVLDSGCAGGVTDYYVAW